MDRARIDEFLGRFMGYASGATTMALLAIADRCGLSSWLGEHSAGTVEEIAHGAGLNPRYVREILSGLAAAGVVEYSAGNGVFTLPPEHALFLSTELSPYFMGGWLDMLPSAMAKVDRLAEVTAEGGGIPFEDFGEEFMRGLDRGNGPSQRILLVNRWLAAIPGILDRLEEGIRVADVGCGTGTAATVIAGAFPDSEVVGFDVSATLLEQARSRSGSLTNLEFVNGSARDFPAQPPFDLILTLDVIHDLADPLAGLIHIRESLADDGQYLMMEPNVSSRLEENLDDRGALFYGISTLHCMTQSLAVGGEGLGAAWGRERAEEYARRAGFTTFQPLDEITNRFSAFYLLEP